MKRDALDRKGATFAAEGEAECCRKNPASEELSRQQKKEQQQEK